MERLGVRHISWSPFAEGTNNFFKNPTLIESGKAYSKSVGQVVLRCLIDSNVAVIPKSTHKACIQEDINVFDFDLIDDKKKQIAAFAGGKPLIFDHSDSEFIGKFLKSVKDAM